MKSETVIVRSKIITIDGPAGSGKSTVAKVLASQLGWIYVTTGAIYRALVLMLLESGTELTDHGTIDRYVAFLNERYRQDSRSGSVFLGDRNVTLEIKVPNVSKLASVVAQDPFVRKRLLPLQRRIALETNGAVVDGRDMGTVVFPDALLKIFLTASIEVRAARRAAELAEQGINSDILELTKEIEERDNRDSCRVVAPLVQSIDAIKIDSSKVEADSVVTLIMSHYRNKLAIQD